MPDTQEAVIEDFQSPEAGASDGQHNGGALSEKQLVAKLGFRKELDRHRGVCENGQDWCDLQILIPPSDEENNAYDRAVVGTTRLAMRVALGIGTFFLGAGHLFRGRRRMAMVAYQNKLRTAVLRTR